MVWSEATWSLDGNLERTVDSFSGGSVPRGIVPAEEYLGTSIIGEEYTAQSVGSWCDACVANGITRDVLHWDEFGWHMSMLVAMSTGDVSDPTVLGSATCS